jgi:hypothetical protein
MTIISAPPTLRISISYMHVRLRHQNPNHRATLGASASVAVSVPQEVIAELQKHIGGQVSYM